jgi:prolyl oligopeptidase
MTLRAWVALAAVLVATGGLAQTTTTTVGSTGADAALHALFDREWEWELTQDPLWASYLGDRRWNDRWPDIAPAALAARQAHRQGVLKELATIPRDRLSPANRTNYDVFKYQYEMTVEGYQHRYHLIRTSTLDGVQNTEQVIDSLRFQTVKDFDDWLARLDAFPTYVDQNIVLMREGLKSNVLLPKVIVQRVREQVAELASQSAEQSGYYRPFRSMPGTIVQTDRERLAKAADDRVRTRVQPAFARLLEFLDREYLPACYNGVGWWRTSGGLAAYRYFARFHTTTDLAPQDIHALGLKEVARIRAEMEAIKTQVGFSGTLNEFFTYMRTDPKFFYKSGEELLDGYRVVAKRIDPELMKISRNLPRVTYGVIPVPDAIAPIVPTAYANGGAPDGSRPPYFFANLYKPETRPKWEMMALTLHEGMPGHCLQISVAQELGDLPNFRRHAFFTAYTEGWGLYAESLGEDMGLYKDDPSSKFGQLTYEMWRAVRLVVDTGMHAMEWDRERAIRYFMDNAAKTENDVTNEIDRYISYPGQALAYKIGELKIKELRARAQKTLGGKFDLRDFNDVVLQTGAVPLNILEQRVNEWIAGK